MRKVTFITHWSPQAQFAGYYVAKEKGFYKERGLDVEILPSGPSISAPDALETGKADFAVLWLSQALQSRSKGADIVNICQVIRKSGMMFVARKSSGIRMPEDMNGKKVSLWGGDLRIPAEMFLKKYGLNVTKINQSYTVNLFLAGGVDAAMAMWYNEYHTILSSGLNPDELTVFFFKDHGLNVSEDAIYARQESCIKDPELSKAFVEASIKGWLYAFDHPGEAVEIALNRMRACKIPANAEHQKWMLGCMKSLIIPDGDKSKIGILSPEDYNTIAGMLKDNGLIDKVSELSSFYMPAVKDAQK